MYTVSQQTYNNLNLRIKTEPVTDTTVYLSVRFAHTVYKLYRCFHPIRDRLDFYPQRFSLLLGQCNRCIGIVLVSITAVLPLSI